jgi:hypothetical protein
MSLIVRGPVITSLGIGFPCPNWLIPLDNEFGYRDQSANSQFIIIEHSDTWPLALIVFKVHFRGIWCSISPNRRQPFKPKYAAVRTEGKPYWPVR